MLSERLSEVKSEIKELEKKVKKENDQKELYQISRHLQDLYVEEFDLEKRLGGLWEFLSIVESKTE